MTEIHRLDGSEEDNINAYKSLLGLREDQNIEDMIIDDEGNLLDENGNIIKDQ